MRRFGPRCAMVVAMTRSIAFITLALALASCVAPASVPEQRQAQELIGRIAGKSEHCVIFVPQSTLRISDGDRHTLLYGTGKTIWANNLGQCRFGLDDILVTEPLGSRHCRGDIVRSFDRISHIPGPTCVLSDFVPYHKA